MIARDSSIPHIPKARADSDSYYGADGGGRTHTLSRVLDFESSASANSATSATNHYAGLLIFLPQSIAKFAKEFDGRKQAIRGLRKRMEAQ